MKVAFFYWPSGFASGHESFQATLLEGLLAQDRHPIAVVVDTSHAMPVPAPHEVVPFASRYGRVGRWFGHFDAALERRAAHSVRTSGAAALVSCANFPTPQVAEIPLLATLHETDFLDPTPWHWFPAPMVHRMGAETLRSLTQARAVFANSRYTADRACVEHGVAADAAFVVAPAIQPFGTGPQHLAPFPPYVAQVGWFAARKDMPLAVRGWRRALAQGLDRDLVLIGRDGPVNHVDGPLARQVLEEAGDCHSRVHIVGHVSRAEYGTLLRGADALLATSHQEGFCIPVIEAFSVGTPVVAVRRTALVEVAGPAGLLVDADPESVSRGLMEAVTSPPAQEEMTNYAARFTPANQAAPLLRFLDRLEAESSP